MIVIFATAFVLAVKIAKAYISDQDYASMPDTFRLDDYDQCLSNKENGLYCLVTVQLTPIDLNNSKIWKTIEEVSRSPFNFRHDLLRHGVCVPSFCPSASGEHPRKIKNLKKGLSKCFSEKLKRHGLKGAVTKIHCETSKSPYVVDWVDVAVGIAFLAYLAFLAYASCYELATGFGTKEKSSSTEKFLAAFSVTKNWRRLTTISKKTEQTSFRCIQGLRFFNMLLIIMSHTSMTLHAKPINNTKYTETSFKKLENMIFVNGASSVLTFFVITGFLVSYQFFVAFEKRKSVNFGFLLKSYVARYVRLTPSVMVLLAIHSTWLVHAGRGPNWDRINGVERRNCRKNWWSNLLYIHNYHDAQHMCMQHTWSLGTDMQVFAVCLLVVWLIFHYRNHATKIIVTTVAIGAILHGITHFLNGCSIVMMRYPEGLLDYLISYKFWSSVYILGHTNVPGYVIGVGFGYIFYKSRGQKLIGKSRFYVFLWWFYIFFLQIAIILAGVAFFREDFSCPQYLATLYDVAIKIVFSLAMATLILGVTEGVGCIVKDVLEWSAVQILGKISFNAFLCHSFMMKYRSGLLRTPVYASDSLTLYNTAADIAISYILAVFLSLMVEFPVSALQKSFMFQKPPGEKGTKEVEAPGSDKAQFAKKEN